MVQVADVLSHLQSLYPGQLVLYVEDIAKILGRSEKSLAHLIARDNLPFKIKFVGRLRCVDIFQVAQWLSSDSEVAQEVVEHDVKPKAQPVKPKYVKPVFIKPVQAGSKDEAPVLTGKMAAVLLRARHSQANSLSRFVCGLADLNESQFMSEVLEQIFFTPQEKFQYYSVTTRKLGSARSKRLAQESVEYFDSEDDAADFLVWRLVRPQGLKTKAITHLFLDHLGLRRVHVIITPDEWSIVSNEMGLTLPGFS